MQIQAGAGGVGSFFIKLTKSMGCWVVVTCSGKYVEFLKVLSVDEIINYEVENLKLSLIPSLSYWKTWMEKFKTEALKP